MRLGKQQSVDEERNAFFPLRVEPADAADVLPFTPLRLQTISHKRFLLLMGRLLKLRLLCGKTVMLKSPDHLICILLQPLRTHGFHVVPFLGI